MKRLIVGMLTLLLIGGTAVTASAAKKAVEYDFTLVSNEGGKSNVSGTVRLMPVGNGKTQVHVSAKGLQGDTSYLLTWSTTGDCARDVNDTSHTIASFTTHGNGQLVLTKMVATDLTAIASIGIVSDAGQTLVACAATP